MKKLKMIAAVALSVVLTVGLAACGGGGGGDSTGDAMAAAQKALEDVKSMNYDMTMNMDMAAGEQAIQSVTKGKIAIISDPLQMQMDMTMDMGAMGSSAVKMYAEQKDKDYVMYMSTDNGTSWMKSTVTDMTSLEQYDAKASMDMYLGSVEGFKEAGTEKINGSEATKYEGVISKDAMNDVMSASGAADQFASLGISAEQAAEMYKDLGEIPVTIWIDKESALPVKYDMDMTAVMQSLMSKMMEAMGDAAQGMKLEVSKMTMEMTLSDFNKVNEIKIPDAAKNAPEVAM